MVPAAAALGAADLSRVDAIWLIVYALFGIVWRELPRWLAGTHSASPAERQLAWPSRPPQLPTTYG